jgi:hypothetical protein
MVLALSGCDSPIGTPPDPGPPPGPNASVLVGAGDIARCGTPGAVATAALLDNIPGTVFTAGDNVYTNGDAANYTDCYEPTWGRHLDRTFPVLGNHDYAGWPGAPNYFSYFGSAAGPRGLGYYTYQVGSWRIIALNSEFFANAENGAPNAAAAATQVQWLKNELSANSFACTIAIWHRPLFSSGTNGNNVDMRDLYKAAYDGNVDIVINGHDHNYERFGPQDAEGKADAARGIRQFVVGTGGVTLNSTFNKKTNSEDFKSVYGVLKLTLSPGAYAWDFIPVTGPHDTGSGACH